MPVPIKTLTRSALLAAFLLAPFAANLAQANNVVDGQIFRGVDATTDRQGPHVVIAHDESEWEWLWQNKFGRTPPASLPEGHIAIAGFLGAESVTGYGVHLVHNENMECATCANVVDFFETTPSAMTALRNVDYSPFEILVIETPKPDVTINYHRRFDTAYMPQQINWISLNGDDDTFFAYLPRHHTFFAAGAPVTNVEDVVTNSPTNADLSMKDGKIAESQRTRTFGPSNWDYITTYDNNGNAAWVAR